MVSPYACGSLIREETTLIPRFVTWKQLLQVRDMNGCMSYVSKNRGTAKWMVYNGKTYLGVPLFLETPTYIYIYYMFGGEWTVVVFF